MPEIKPLSLSAIRIDGGTQPRCEIDQNLVAEYAEAMEEDAEFPPVVVFYDGVNYWLADGFHRYHAAKQAGITGIQSEIKQGTQRDAILYSVGANVDHGKRRTNADKRRAVNILLNDAEWGGRSARWVAKTCRVTHTFVDNAKRSLATVASDLEETPKRTRSYISRSGVQTEMNVSNIGKSSSRKEQIRSKSYERVRDFLEGSLAVQSQNIERIISIRENNYPSDLSGALESATDQQIKLWIKILDNLISWSRKMKIEIQNGAQNAQG